MVLPIALSGRKLATKLPMTVTDVDDDTMRLGTFYHAGGIYYILRQWITEPINKTPQEVAVLMYHFLNVD